MLESRRSAATPTHEPERPQPIAPTPRSGTAALFAVLLAVTACADRSPVDLEDETATARTAPEAVSDLGVEEESGTSATLTWTEVDDGANAPASYEIRHGTSPVEDWSEAAPVDAGSCAADPVEGEEIGATTSCEAEGLAAGERYDFRVTPFRVAADGSRIYSPEPSSAATVELPDSAVGGSGGDGSSDGGSSGDGSSGGDGGSGDDGGSEGGSGEGPGDDSDDGDGSEPYPNRPEGFSRLSENTYSAPDEDGWRTQDDEEFSIVADPDAPRSPADVGQARFPAGMGDGRTPIASTVTVSDAGVRRLYLSYWVRLSENWQGHPSKVNKIGFAWTHDKPVVVLNVHGADDGRLASEIRLQDVPDGATNLGPNVSDPEIVRGEWHRWEVVLVLNSGDAADGEVHWWIDGRKAGEYRDVRFGTSGDSKIWQYVSWRPYWGGRGGTVRETMYMWMDHYHVAGAP